MRSVRNALAIVMLGFAVAAQAQDKPCSKADAAAAEKAIDRVMNWNQLHKAYNDYRHCDKDAVADTYTDALLRLAVDWKNVDALASAMNDPGFKAFVHTHLRSPAAKDDREAVYSRAKSNCPKNLDSFCAELAEVVHEEAAKPLELMKPIESGKRAPK